MKFIRSFSQHILPKGFTCIRHFGILSNTSKAAAVAKIKEQIPPKAIPANKKQAIVYNPKKCTCCKTETMVTIELLLREPPAMLQNAKYH